MLSSLQSTMIMFQKPPASTFFKKNWFQCSWVEDPGLLYYFVLFGLVLADFLGGGQIQCLSVFGSCFPFFVLHTKCNPPLSCISVDNYGSITCPVWNYHFHHIWWIVAANGISTQVARSHSSPSSKQSCLFKWLCLQNNFPLKKWKSSPVLYALLMWEVKDWVL